MKNALCGLGIIVLIPFVALAQVAPISKAGSESARSIVGVWRVTGVESRLANGEGEVTHPRGMKPTGYITYEASGRMEVQIMNGDEVRPPREGAGTLTAEQQAQAFRTYTAYFGTYTINEKEGSVVHHVAGSLNPRNIGSDMKRFFEVTGERLALKIPSADGQRVTTNSFERVK